MNLLAYICFRTFVSIFAVSPFWLLYWFSDGLFFLFYKVFAYRYQVVLDNLKIAFPEKSEEERKEIAKVFYQNLCDVILESIKGLSLSKSELMERYKYTNASVFDRQLASNQSVFVAGGHFANWEWGVLSFSLWMQHQVVGVYKPIKNVYIDRYFNQKRQQWGLTLSSMQHIGRTIIKQRNTPTAFVFIADQTPSNLYTAQWLPFLGQDTPFFPGLDKIAQKTNYPVYYFDIQRVKRGFYEVTFSPIELAPADQLPEQVSSKYIKHLERSIKTNPPLWLWSHRRWKHQRSTTQQQPA
ncbi:MAG: lysophospholipid acyltransferase family protein [Bacteroidota bacterium]